jgi:ubiquinone/menaquinone biosynthesis C-methylase UbiE
MIEDTTFDEVVCHMSLMDIENLAGTITEAARVINMGGRFLFSIMHPCFCMPNLQSMKDLEEGSSERITYFDEGSRLLECLEDDSRTGWRFHRTLTSYINAVAARGFTIRRISEPRPTEETVSKHPELEPYLYRPVALIVEAVFPHV